jgi:hypothetical protein
VAAEEWQKLLPEGNTALLQKWKNTVTKMDTIFKNNYAMNNTVAKFCELFTVKLVNSTK